ncbi:MAG: hypothetical protein QOI58_3426 [Thermoanaerobaculia bacterium]|jgi:hypothetical protein|nr:hypothetical protein [Thermoanaerobaculia bacterium]
MQLDLKEDTVSNDGCSTHDDVSPALTANDRIHILLSEYSTLRAEIVSRTANGFTLTTIGITVLIWVLKELSTNSPLHSWLGAFTLLVVLGLGVFVNLRDITRAARRVKSLEHEINSRAGEHLLIWETLSGVATRKGGVVASFFSSAKTLPRSELPPLQARGAEKHAAPNDSVSQGEVRSSAQDSWSGAHGNMEIKALFRSAKFLAILASGVALVSIQGLCAYLDGYFSQTQILEIHRLRGAYAFIEHGGMWADVFITTPIVAYIITSYRLPYLSRRGLMLLAVVIAVSLVAGVLYQEMGKVVPEAHTHFGHTPLAGWIHWLYAIPAIWICAMFYLTPIDPRPGVDIIFVSIGLTALFALGVMKFNNRWSWSTEALVQVAVSIALLWVATAYRFGRHIEHRLEKKK